MTNDLTEVVERIEFCENEISVFESEERDYFSNSLVLRQSPNLVMKTNNYFVKLKAPIPVSLKSRAGIITHELRACLDSLACKLALRNGALDIRDVYFPVAKSSSTFESNEFKKIKKLSVVDQKKISDIGPFRGGHPSLFQLHEADKIHKHVRLAGQNANGGYIRLGNFMEFPIGSGPLSIDNTMIDGVCIKGFRLDPTKLVLEEPDNEILFLRDIPFVFQVSISCQLCYLEPEDLVNQSVKITLQKFVYAVREIVSKFI